MGNRKGILPNAGSENGTMSVQDLSRIRLFI